MFRDLFPHCQLELAKAGGEQSPNASFS
jgi:hypothetical protein